MEFLIFSSRHGEANSKYLKSYDPKQELKDIIYIDANNLYGYAVSKFLLASGFKWIGPKEFDLSKCNSKSSKGSVLEVDLNIQKNYVNYTMIILQPQIK